MPITINGTTVTTNSINGTSIGVERVNGITVYSATLSKKWVYITYETSQPRYDYYAFANGTTQEDWVDALESEWPVRNLAVGTMGYVITIESDSMYPIFQVQEV